MILKIQFNYGLQSFPVLFMITVLTSSIILYPFLIIEISLSLLIFILLSSISIIYLLLTAYSSTSKYSILGSIRLITQLISFELIWTTLLLIIIYYSSVLITYYLLYYYLFYSLLFSYLVLYLLFIISVLADSNRTPFDLPEAESELVAGFLTEYSSIYFSIILLTEYGNIIVFINLLIILLSITSIYLIYLLLLVCLIRSSFNRLKYDELMINTWIIILPSVFIIYLLLIY